MAGKGSKKRPGNDDAYRNTWERIWGDLRQGKSEKELSNIIKEKPKELEQLSLFDLIDNKKNNE